MTESQPIEFYQDSVHPCSYMGGRQAQNIYPDPNKELTNHLYSQLITHGFRRSGNLAYRPHCINCQACVPVRINIANFTLSRSQKRCLSRNKNVSMNVLSASFNPEHFDLYSRYLAARHQGAGMDNPTQESYLNFLTSSWSDTKFIEFREDNQLLAVAVTDVVHDGLSALYTFFDPNLAKRSLGSYGILQQIKLAQDQDIPWLYLGYWIEDCQKMQYKQNFSGLEAYTNQQWQPLTT